MRVADKMNHNQVIHNLNKNRWELSKFQNQAATQKRINKPSDDPLGAARILETRTEMQGFNQFEKNIVATKGFIEFSERSLGEINDLLIRAKELAVQQASDGASGPETRKMVAMEIHQIFEQMVNIGNRKFGDRYLFGGYKTLKAPFDMQGNYYGDDAEVEVPIDKDAKMVMNIPGSKVFLGKRINDPVGSTKVLDPQLLEDEYQPEVDPPAEIRGPASLQNALVEDPTVNDQGYWGPNSVNIFSTMRALEVGLKANDKAVVQNSLDFLDDGLNQINLARAELGSRISVLNTGLETVQKLQVDAKIMESEIEDIDMYELVNNLNRTQNQLEASMATSGKMIQSSLLDFLR
ncbi:MAG: flagellar hook-associated protein FlgL [Bdellovibrionales bacterium]|nr:flagellar hook-associated protein FlgL [Bdellovibrionales bacterium]